MAPLLRHTELDNFVPIVMIAARTVRTETFTTVSGHTVVPRTVEDRSSQQTQLSVFGALPSGVRLRDITLVLAVGGRHYEWRRNDATRFGLCVKGDGA